MKSLTRRLLVGTGIVTLIGGLAACGGHYRHGDVAGHAERLVERASGKLDLNETQKEKLSALRNEMASIGTSIHARREETRSEVLELLEQPTIDRNRALTLVQMRIAAMNTPPGYHRRLRGFL